MDWLRTTHRFVRVLMAIFVVAQFAGAVSSPLVRAETVPSTLGSHVHHGHLHERDGTAGHHHGNDEGLADHCCALHAIFVGVLAPAISIQAIAAVSTRLAFRMETPHPTSMEDRLDRPPKPSV